MAEKKNQHYVAKHYFKIFSDGKDFIAMYVIGNKNIVPTASISDQASKSYFYGDAAVEDEMCKLEDAVRQPFLGSISSENFDFENRRAIIRYLLLQEARTSKKRAQTKSAFQAIEATMSLAKHAKNINQAKDWLRNNSLAEISADVKKWHWHLLQLAVDGVWQLNDMQFAILEAPKDTEFIFSDAPVVAMNPHMRHFSKQGVVGLLSKGLILLFPLSPKYSAIFFDGDVYSLTEKYKTRKKTREKIAITENDLLLVNQLQYLFAEKCLYSRNPKMLSPFSTQTRSNDLSEFSCGITNEGETPAGLTVKIHGVLKETPDLPGLPFFTFKLAQKLVQARPTALKIYKEKSAKRLARLKNIDLGKISGANADEMMRLLSLNGDYMNKKFPPS